MLKSNTVFTQVHDETPLQSSVSKNIPIQDIFMFLVLFIRFNLPPELTNGKQDTNPFGSGVTLHPRQKMTMTQYVTNTTGIPLHCS